MHEEKLNEEAARNNNLDSATIRTSVDVSKQPDRARKDAVKSNRHEKK